MSDAKNNPHVAAIYRAMALRFYLRYVDARCDAEHRGGDLVEHGHLPSQRQADDAYEAAVNGFLWETPSTADAAMALAKFAGVLAADRLIGEVTGDIVCDQRDAYHQSVALANAVRFLNEQSIDEFIESEREGRAGKPKPKLTLLH
jgi:hypothetical protein